MKNVAYYASALAATGLCLYFGLAGSTDRAMAKTAPDTETQAVVTATTAFLDSLSPDQRTKVEFPFTPQKTATAVTFKTLGPNMGPPEGFVAEQYGQAVWSNFPASAVPRLSGVPRPGLTIGSLTPAQRNAEMHLLQVLLSRKGYQKVLDIMGSDQALHERGTNFVSGADYYTIGIFGAPSTTTPWMLEFGAHHLGLNVVIAGKQGVMTPTLTGAQPAVYTANGKTVRTLAQENDKAFALLDALDEGQRKQAILNYHVGDLVLGPGEAGKTIQPEGLKASAMNEKQQAMLLDVISEWAGIVNDAYAAPRMAEIKAGLADTYFAWSGPTTHDPGQNGSSYYRIQGPRLVIEFSPQDTNGDITQHVHTIYRDPTNDYGVKFTNPQ